MLLIRTPTPRFLHGPFLVGGMDRPLSSWGYGLAPFYLGIWTGPFAIGDTDRPLSGWGYGLAPFYLGIWAGPFTTSQGTREQRPCQFNWTCCFHQNPGISVLFPQGRGGRGVRLVAQTAERLFTAFTPP